MSEQNQIEKATDTQSRRKFLRRAGTGAVIASLPMKSVWANGITHSIVASGHGSDWASGEQIVLRSQGYWGKNIPRSDKRLIFEDFFSAQSISFKPYWGNGEIGTSTPLYKANSDGSASSVIYKPTLGNIMTGGNGSKRLKNVSRFVFGSGELHPAYKNNSYNSNNNSAKFKLSGPGNVNLHMIAMYLNAKYHGPSYTHSVNYPVIQSFRSLNAYVGFLGDEYSMAPKVLGDALSNVIGKCGSGCDGTDFV